MSRRSSPGCSALCILLLVSLLSTSLGPSYPVVRAAPASPAADLQLSRVLPQPTPEPVVPVPQAPPADSPPMDLPGRAASIRELVPAGLETIATLPGEGAEETAEVGPGGGAVSFLGG